jgi:C1A family cysteine protease
MTFSIKDVSLKGWIPSVPDHRDFKYHVPGDFLDQDWPDSVDLSNLGIHTPRVENQGPLSSCVAQSVTSALEYVWNKDKMYHLEYSRMFVWYYARMFQGWETVNSGSYIRDAFKAVYSYGCPIEELWPYEAHLLGTEPDRIAQENAKLKMNRLEKYSSCRGLSSILDAISSGFPVVGGFAVPESIDSKETVTKGVVHYPELGEKTIGGHAVLFVGYDQENQWLKFENSWGLGWGDFGFGYLPFEYLTNGLASDFWTPS